MTAPATQTHEDDILGKAYDRKLMRRLLVYTRPYRALMYGAFALLCVEGGLEVHAALGEGKAVVRLWVDFEFRRDHRLLPPDWIRNCSGGWRSKRILHDPSPLATWAVNRTPRLRLLAATPGEAMCSPLQMGR